MLCSFCFAISNLTLDILVPELYINQPEVPKPSLDSKSVQWNQRAL